MTHFADARRNGLSFFTDNPAVRARLERVCLIWDLQGCLRVLVKPRPGQDGTALAADIDRELGPGTDPFWSRDTWVWTDDSTPAEKAIYEAAWNEARDSVVDGGPPEIRLLERHVAKSAWFAARHAAPWPLNDRTPPILSFYSFKGGVGRTTAMLSLAIQLARAGHRAGIVDLDLEAPGVMSTLPPGDGLGPPCGVIDYFLERPLVTRGEDLHLSDYYYAYDDTGVIGDGPPLTVVPAGRLDPDYLQKLARLDYERLASAHDGAPDHPRSPLTDLLTRLRADRQLQYVLIDARAGLHDLGGLALSEISHLDVIFGVATEQNWRGLDIVVRFLGRERIARGLEQLDCALVQALAPEPGPFRDAVVDEFKERAYRLFSNEYYDEEGSPGEWPVPDPEAEEQPHFPSVLGFDPRLLRYQAVRDVADHLVAGDFRRFAERILDRVGRRLS
jgi:hypothetical protein